MLLKNPPIQITDSLYMLGTNEYPLYLVKYKDQAAIFEGGVGAMGPVLRDQFRKLDVDPESVGQIVITHAHPDHVMAVPMLREMFVNAEVCASKEAEATLMAEKAVKFFSKVDVALTESLIKAGSITAQQQPEPLKANQIPVDRTIGEGDTVAVGNMVFAVIETPGHSNCSLSFYEGTESILIISDATGYYMPEHGFFWPNYFANYRTYLDSIRRLGSLSTEVLCLSHNAAIKGANAVRAYFEGAISATEAYHERIVALAKAGKTAKEIAEQLGAQAYDKIKLLPVDFFEKNCSILVKQSLKHEGIKPQKG